MRNTQNTNGGMPQESESCKQQSLTNTAAPHTGRGTKQIIMKTHLININTVVMRLGIFVLLLFAVQSHAQTIVNPTGKLIASNRNINVDYKISAGNMATFTWSGAALRSGEQFSIALPVVAGYSYDMAHIKLNSGLAFTAIASSIMVTGEAVSFTCPLVVVAPQGVSSPTVQFVKK